MPRKMPAGWDEMMARKDKRIESHSTLRLIIDNGDILRAYYFASARLTIDGVEYQPELRRSSRIKASLTRAADAGDVEIQNVDTEIGKEFLALGEAIYGAEAKIGRWWRDLTSGWEDHKVFLTGPVVGFDPDENVVRLRAVSEPYANISVGARRVIDPLCQAVYRDPSTCGFSGPGLPTCNLMLNHADGCKGRHGLTPTLERAKFMGQPFVNAASRFKTL